MDNSNYSELYTWFENSGIVSNVRTHLRKNLVNALKTNASLCVTNAEFRSAEQYVYDMLIAEYLLNYNYTYTLSVFASEAPLLINLQQHTEVHADTAGGYSKNKLPDDYVFHTLQTLGINPQNLDGQNILSQYVSSKGPLILCIIRYLISIFSNISEKNNQEKTIGHNQQIQNDNTKSIGSHKSTLLSKAKEKLYQQKERFSTQLKNKEFELREQAVLIERQIVLLNEKLERAQNLMQLVDAKEDHLTRERMKSEEILYNREMELSIKEKLLTQEAVRLQKERDSYRTFEGDMKKLQGELAKMRNELPCASVNVIEIDKRDAYVQTDIFNNSPATEDLRLLNEEKEELSSLVREQQSRIEELTMRAVTLSRQLEEAQLAKSPDINPSHSLVRHANVNTIFSESSSTEDILQDAKMRLRRLEEESLRADQYFYNCITSP